MAELANNQASVNVSVNPLSKPITAQVETKLVEMKEIKFNFRSVATTDETGAVIKDDKGNEVKWKRPSYKKTIPCLTVAGLLAALQAGDKTTELVLDQSNDAIINRARGLISDIIDSNPKVELVDESLDVNQLNFVTIANLPKGERGAGISKEEWAAFVVDYIATMQKPDAIAQFPDKKPRTLEVLQKHGVLLSGKFNQVRSRKDVVEQMLTFLDIWVTASENAEDFLPNYELLTNKGKAILQSESFDDL